MRLFLTNTDANLLDLDCDQLPLGATANTNLTPSSPQPYAKVNANLTPSLRQHFVNIAANVDPAYASLCASARRKGQRGEEASKNAQLHGGQVDEDQGPDLILMAQVKDANDKIADLQRQEQHQQQRQRELEQQLDQQEQFGQKLQEEYDRLLGQYDRSAQLQQQMQQRMSKMDAELVPQDQVDSRVQA